MAEKEAEMIERKWRETLEEKAHWEANLKVKVLLADAKHHRLKGREEAAKRLEALAKEVSN